MAGMHKVQAHKVNRHKVQKRKEIDAPQGERVKECLQAGEKGSTGNQGSACNQGAQGNAGAKEVKVQRAYLEQKEIQAEVKRFYW